MKSVARFRKPRRLRGQRLWAGIFFEPNRLDLAIARPTGDGEVNLVDQSFADITAAGDPPDTKAALARAAAQLRAKVNPREHRLVTAIGCEDVLFQTLTLPSVDRDEIRQMLELQIDSLTPLPLEEVVYDFQPLEVADGHTRVLVALARKESVNERVAALEQAGLPPDIVTVDILALFRGLMKRNLLPLDDKLNVLVLMRERTANLIVHSRGNPLVVRSLMLEENPPDTDGGREALLEELHRTLVAAAAEQPGAEVGVVSVLTWGEGLRAAAEQIVQHWEGRSEFLNNGAVPAPALSLCLECVAGDQQALNLLPDEWREQRRRARLRQRLIQGGIMVVFAYLIALVGFLSFMAWKRSQSAELDRQIRDIKPAHESARRVEAQLRTMQRQLDRRFSSLEVMREATSRLPGNVKLNLFVYKKDRASLSMRGQAQSADSIYDFVKRLEESDLFAKVEPGQIRTDPRGLTQFEILCTLKTAAEVSRTAHATQ
jgi:Tfp pilus assembly protein PilN